jgi:redox-sensitive bicupin YhaK (pirin superfamily)
MLAGEVDHRDSVGDAGTTGAGGVQGMTASGGIFQPTQPLGAGLPGKLGNGFRVG